MFQNFLIGLREGLEAALVVCILLGYLNRLGDKQAIRRLWLGIAIAITVSVAVGAALTFGPSTLTFEAQEAIGGILSIVAVGFVTWMVFWLGKTSKTLASDLRNAVDQARARGSWGLVMVGALAVGREGLETTLFLWAATRSATSGETGGVVSPSAALLAALVGIGIAVVLAWLITRGLLKLNLAKFFQITGVFLIIIAAGVLAYGVHDLQEAGILPGLYELAFDVSHVIPPSSWYGTLLKGIFNFSPATTWLEAIAWLSYTAVVLPLYLRLILRREAVRQPEPESISA